MHTHFTTIVNSKYSTCIGLFPSLGLYSTVLAAIGLCCVSGRPFGVSCPSTFFLLPWPFALRPSPFALPARPHTLRRYSLYPYTYATLRYDCSLHTPGQEFSHAHLRPPTPTYTHAHLSTHLQNPPPNRNSHTHHPHHPPSYPPTPPRSPFRPSNASTVLPFPSPLPPTATSPTTNH